MAQQTDKKPNILVIWGDDIGIANFELLFARSHGLSNAQHRSYRQGRNAVHGFYGEQSCTAGRASFITGQS